MRTKLIFSLAIYFYILLLTPLLFAQTKFYGTVYLDENHNLRKDAGEKGMNDVLVSNGRDVVQTNSDGSWSFTAISENSIFVIQPSGFKVPVNASMVPQHFSVGNGASKALNFSLWKGNDSDDFEALFFGDTQARGLREVNYVSHDVVEECIGSNAAFGVALGDIVADDPELFDEIASSIGQIGVPWYYVFGNHDHDHDAQGNIRADKTFIKNFGPSSYAFEFGQVVFISLNNVFFKEQGGYKAHFTDNQLQFVGNYLKHVPKEKLVVLMMHIPIIACDNREDMFRLLEKRPNTFSLAGHTHQLAHVFVDEKYGWKGAKPHHHFINGTVSGSWWCGLKDELGIPHATMNDGAPNGYAAINFTGNTYNIKYKAARKPENYQMNIYLPDEIPLISLDTTKVLVNVFNGSEKSKVEMQIDHSGNWVTLNQTKSRDPANMVMHELGPFLDVKVNEKPLDEVFGWKMDYPGKSSHFWQGDLSKDLDQGTHTVTVRTIDMFGNTYLAHRIFRIL